MASVVRSSIDQAVNIPQLIVDPITQEQLVCVYKWSEFLDKFFKHIPNILSYQIFEVSSSKPGVFSLRKSSSSAIEEISTLRNSANSIAIGQLPEQIPLKGLSLDRQWYLYEHIREYCTTEEAADSTCPKSSRLLYCQQPLSYTLSLSLMQQQQANTSNSVQYVTVQVTTSARVHRSKHFNDCVFTLYTLLDWIVYVPFCEACTSSHNVHNDLVFDNNKEHQ